MSRFIALLYSAACYALFLAVFLYAIGFVSGVAVPKDIDDGVAGPLLPAVLVNTVLLLVFALQHSVMARPGFKRVWTRIVPPVAERSTFVLATCIALVLLFWQWRPLPALVWHVEEPAVRVALYAFAAIEHHRRVLDAVAGVRARRLQRRQGDHQLWRGHAVHGDRDVVGVPCGDPGGELVEVEIGVVQDPLAGGQAVHPLAQLAAAVCEHQLHDVLGVEIRRGVGDARDTAGAQLRADLRQSGFLALQRFRPGRIGASQPAVGVVGLPDTGETGRVQRPQHPAAVLDAYRNRRGKLVEQRAVQWPRDRLVVANGPDPSVGADVGFGQYPGQVRGAVHVAGTDPDRRQRRGRRPQMDVMVVQTGDDGSARGIVDLFARTGIQPLVEGGDAVGDPDVDDVPVQQRGPLDQHEASPQSASICSTAALSAPRGAAGPLG